MLTLIAHVLSVSEALSFILKSILRSFSKALIINITHCNLTTWFEFLKNSQIKLSNESLLKN